LYGKDLNGVILILSENSRRVVESSEFPLAISVSDLGVVLYGSAAENAPILWARYHEERIYVQPESGHYAAYYNDIAIEGSTWLSAGDRLAFGDASLHVGEVDGMLSFSSAVSGVLPEAGESESETVTPEPLKTEKPVEALIAASPSARSIQMLPRWRWASIRNRKIAFGGIFILLLVAGFVLGASPVRIVVAPQPNTVSFRGLIPPIAIGARYLTLPGNYTVSAQLAGYRDLEKNVTIGFGTKPDLKFDMQKLPGRLRVTTSPVTGATVTVDGKAVGKTPLRDFEIEAGKRIINVTSDRYLRAVKTLEIRGKGEAQSVEFELKPAWGTLVVSSTPDQADVALGSENIGKTPLTAAPLQGSYGMTLSRDGWKPVVVPVKIEAGRTIKLPPFKMERIDGTLSLKTDPPGATVTINGQFSGRTPLSLPLISEQTYDLKLTKSGYVSAIKRVRIEGGKTNDVDLRMTSEYGIVFIRTRPAGAVLKIDGKTIGTASRRLRLTARPHRIEVVRKGYATFSATVTPRKGISKRLNVRLKRLIDVAREKARRDIKTKSGHIVRLIPIETPVRFQVGASRREAGRRSNETQFTVELSRSFMIGTREVTNQQFRQFRSRHNSGTEQGRSLNGARYPVAKVAWGDAARFLNWLSRKEGLPPAYVERGGKMVATQPLTDGYRLPTEAEWVYAARYEAGARSLLRPLKYPWGRALPPSRGSGNYADSGATGVLPLVLKSYADGYIYAAPVASFRPNGTGLHDLGGNVSEWCHDYYDTFVGSLRKIRRDPTGPRRGEFHVVRGSSWRHGSITELRLSYRDYTKTPRNDLGFRIARYVNIPN
jgi:formylglycine-generating enzyme required for sulfatase activity